MTKMVVIKYFCETSCIVHGFLSGVAYAIIIINDIKYWIYDAFAYTACSPDTQELERQGYVTVTVSVTTCNIVFWVTLLIFFDNLSLSQNELGL